MEYPATTLTCPRCHEAITEADLKPLWVIPSLDEGGDQQIYEHRPKRGCGKWLSRRHGDTVESRQHLT